MSIILFLISLFILFNSVFTIEGLKPQIPGIYEIAPWKDFKPSAITYSFDDGTKNQYVVALPLFDKYELKASFNLITQFDFNWELFKNASLHGHEVTSHTITHPNLNGLDKEQQEKELKESKEKIESEIGKECITIVYPYCAAGDLDIMKKYYISGRSCDGKLISPNPDNMFDLSSFGIGSESQYTTAEHLNQLADRALSEEKWIIYLIHGVDDDGGYSPIDSNELESHLIYVKELNSFWVDTFVNISKYLIERNSIIIEEKEGKDEGVEINVDCGYETEITKMDFPVTVSREVENEGDIKNAKIVDVSDEKEEIKVTVSDKKIIFDVIPGHKYLLTFGKK